MSRADPRGRPRAQTDSTERRHGRPRACSGEPLHAAVPSGRPSAAHRTHAETGAQGTRGDQSRHPPTAKAGGGHRQGHPRERRRGAGGAPEAGATRRAVSPRQTPVKERRAARPGPRARDRSAQGGGEPAPRQGFESEPTRAHRPRAAAGWGRAASNGALEIVGEVARAGVSAGERLLKDLSRAAIALSARGRFAASPTASERHRRAAGRGLYILAPRRAVRDPGRGGAGDPIADRESIRWGESARQGRSAAHSAARARQLTP